MPFHTALPAFTVLCKPRSHGTWHIFHSQKIHWRFSGWIIQTSSSQMFPTNAYLRIMGQSSQDIKHSYQPLGGRSLRRLRSEHSALWLDPWLKEMELEPANGWDFTSQMSNTTAGLWLVRLSCDLALKHSHNSSITSHSYCTSAMQGDSWKPILLSQAPKQASIFVQVFLSLVLVQWQWECGYMGFPL